MRAIEIMNELYSWAPDFSGNTVDTLKAGSPDVEVGKVAVCCFATPQVIREAAQWGAKLLITHEPTYYDHHDVMRDAPVAHAKKALLESTGMALYRYHDYPHSAPMDLICEGELRRLNLPGRFEKGNDFGTNRYILDQPITPRELASRIEREFGIAHVRVCGTMDEPCTKLVTAWGTPGGVFDELCGESEIVMTGEACEWALGEYARDAAQLGFKKALLILGHYGSEHDGMRHIANLLASRLPELEVRYFESGEVYSYADGNAVPRGTRKGLPAKDIRKLTKQMMGIEVEKWYAWECRGERRLSENVRHAVQETLSFFQNLCLSGIEAEEIASIAVHLNQERWLKRTQKAPYRKTHEANLAVGALLMYMEDLCYGFRDGNEWK